MKRLALLFSAVLLCHAPLRADDAAPQGAPASSPKKSQAFLDVMLGASSATMDLDTSTSFSDSSVTGLETGSSGVFGMRIGGFGEIFGGDIEFSAFSHGNTRQRATINGVTFPGLIMPQDFLHVNTFAMSGDLLMRFPTGDKIIPYFGLGMGISMNNVTSDSSGVALLMGDGTRLNQTVPGFMFRVPFGLRLRVADSLDVFGEGRIWTNTFTFDQEISGVTNTLTQQGFQFLTGLGLRF